MTDIVKRNSGVRFAMDTPDEDAEAKALMEQWGLNDDNDDDDDIPAKPDTPDEGDYDDYLEQFRRTVYPGEDELDHIILGTNNLDRAVEDFKDMTGIKPVFVVSLNRVGTKSARIAFQLGATFLEIIGPDPKQATPTTDLAQALVDLPTSGMVPLHYAVRSSGTIEKKSWTTSNLTCDRVTMIAKDRGQAWKWDMHIMEGHDEGGLIPYFVDWGDAHHASGRLPIVGELKKVQVQASSTSPVHKLLSVISGIDVSEGDNLLKFTFTSPKGEHTFSCADPFGVVFPK